jgi:hypothetical protein
MLSTQRDAGRTMTCNNNIVDESGKWRYAANKESGHCAPIGRELGRVAVNAVEVIHVRYRDPFPSDNIITICWSALLRCLDISVDALSH